MSDRAPSLVPLRGNAASVRRFRQLLLCAAVCYPGWLLVVDFTSPHAVQGTLSRLAIGCLCLVVALATWPSAWVRRVIEPFCCAACCIIVSHNAYFLQINHFDLQGVVGYVLVLFGLSISFESHRYLVGFIAFTSVVTLAACLVANPEAPAFLLGVSALILMMSYVAFRDKLQVLESLKHRNKELEIAEMFLTKTAEVANIGGWSLTIPTQELWWSKQTYLIHEVEPGTPIELKSAIEYYSVEARPIITAAVARALANHESYDLELPLITAKGRRIWVRAIGQAIYENGRATRVIGAFQDITQKRDQQAQLIHTSKMATLGEMSGGVAHEINNPLTVIMGFAQRIKISLDAGRVDDAECRKATDRIIQMTERIAKIVRGLRTFAREASQDPFSRVAIHRVVEDSLELGRERLLNSGVDVRTAAFSGDLVVDCRMVEISQVLINLVNNSFDAIRDLPVKWIEISAEDLGDFVRVSVTDSGPGIAPEIAEKILQPFFTTKPVGVGTGLGLSISKGIVESHGGQLHYDATAGTTRFVFTLPKRQRVFVAA